MQDLHVTDNPSSRRKPGSNKPVKRGYCRPLDSIQGVPAFAGEIAYDVAASLGARHCLNIFPFSRLREKVPDRADEGVGPTAPPETQTAAFTTRSELEGSVNVSAKGHPHPALRATFSRKREKGSLQQYLLKILICDGPAAFAGMTFSYRDDDLVEAP